MVTVADSQNPLETTLNQTNCITLFEYETTDRLSGRDLVRLSRLSRQTGLEILKPSVRNNAPCLQSRQYVGTVRLGKKTIQILPKIHSDANRESCEQEAAQNLLLMLDYAGYLGIREAGLASLQRSFSWFEVLIHLFATHLKRQWRQSASRSYQSVEENLPVLKGKWQIAAQMRRPEQKHRFSVIYDEFTVDNPLNRLLRYVVELLWRLTQESRNRQQLFELRYWMDEVTLLPAISIQDVEKIQLTRLNNRYEPLLSLARLFLKNIGLQLSAGDCESFAFVFDMNRIFEQFLVAFIQRHRREVLPDNLQLCELRPQGQRTTKYLATYRGQSTFHLRPDLVFCQGDRYPLIIDFKYKRIDERAHKLGIAESDFYQIYAYLKRFNSPKVILIYPQSASLSAPLRARFELDEQNQSIYAATVCLLKNLNSPIAKDALKTELNAILETAYD